MFFLVLALNCLEIGKCLFDDVLFLVKIDNEDTVCRCLIIVYQQPVHFHNLECVYLYLMPLVCVSLFACTIYFIHRSVFLCVVYI